MPSAEIITIGTEILLGEIIDTNARHIARVLRNNGVDVYRTSSIGDNVKRIAEAFQESLARADIVITTGGLGPTVDDPTRDAAALALGVETEFHETLWQQVIDRFARFDRFPADNNRRQAYLPQGAEVIVNPVGTAPAFRIENQQGVVICLPGVPREMEHLLEFDVLPYLRTKFQLNSVVCVRIIHTAGAGESAIDEKIGDLEGLRNPTVGLAAHAGTVDVRIAAKAENEEKARELIAPIEAEVRARLGSWVFGADEESLESIALDVLKARGWRLAILEAGLEGKLLRRFAAANGTFQRGEALPIPPENHEKLLEMLSITHQNSGAEVSLGAAVTAGNEKAEIFLALITPERTKSLRVPYGGPPKLAQRRAVNFSLDLLRKIDKLWPE